MDASGTTQQPTTTPATATTPRTTTATAATAATTATTATTANTILVHSRADEPPNTKANTQAQVRPRVGPGSPAMSSLSSPPFAARAGHELPFVAPSSYLRPSSRNRTIPPPPIATPMSPIDEEQMQGLVSPISQFSPHAPAAPCLWPHGLLLSSSMSLGFQRAKTSLRVACCISGRCC